MDFDYLHALVAPHPTIQLSNVENHYPFLHITHSQGSATIALHGAHVTAFAPTDEAPVLFTSESAVFKDGKAIRGGIPICWPWFSGHPNQADFPAHGFARNRFWTLKSVDTSEKSVELTFTLPLGQDTEHLIASTTEVELAVSISDQLTIALTSRNLGEGAIEIGGALHSYFCVADIAAIEIDGLDATSRFNSLNGKTSTHHGAITFDQEYDSVFIPTDATTTIVDREAKRNIIIEKHNSLATCVWNPWIEKSNGMADLKNDDYLRFVCIEALNWRQDLRVLAPGESHTLGQTIRCTRYDG